MSSQSILDCDAIRFGVSLVDDDLPDFALSQYAQDPLEGFSQRYPELSTTNQHKEKYSKNKRVKSKHQKSYIISKNQKKGHRLIQIKVIDISSDSVEKDEDKLLLSAQYIAKDEPDEIMDDTQNIIKKISKKVCCGLDGFY